MTAVSATGRLVTVRGEFAAKEKEVAPPPIPCVKWAASIAGRPRRAVLKPRAMRWLIPLLGLMAAIGRGNVQPVMQGTLSLHVLPGADVSIDGRPLKKGVTEDSYQLSPGPHELSLTQPDFQPWTRRIEIESGKELSQSVKLDPKPAKLKIDAEPRDANILVDNVYRGTAFESLAQPILVNLPQGENSKMVKLRVFKASYFDETQVVQVTANREKLLQVKLRHLEQEH